MTKGHNRLREFFSQIDQLEDKIDGLNSSKSDVYQQAKAEGFDVKVMRVVLSRRKMDQTVLQERDALVELYEGVIKGLKSPSGTKPATRARTRDEAGDADE